MLNFINVVQFIRFFELSICNTFFILKFALLILEPTLPMKFVQNQFPQNASCHVELIFYHKHVLQCSFYHRHMLMRVTIQSQLVKPTWVYCFFVGMCNSLKAKLSLQLSLLNEE